MTKLFVKVTGLHKIFNISTINPNILNTDVVKDEYLEYASSIMYIIADNTDELYGYIAGDCYTWGNGLLVGNNLIIDSSISPLKTWSSQKIEETKQDILIPGDGIDISTNNVISVNSETEYIKYYATMSDYNNDNTRSEDVCVSYILDIDKVIFEHIGQNPSN